MKTAKFWKAICLLLVVGITCFLTPFCVYASDTDNNGDTDERTYEDAPGSAEDGDDLTKLNVGNTVTIELNNGNGTINGALQIVFILTAIALVPFLLLILTSFTRIIIVLHFTRQALNTQTAPPNMVLIGLALFLTIYIMSPVFTQIYSDAIVPMNEGTMELQEAFEAGHLLNMGQLLSIPFIALGIYLIIRAYRRPLSPVVNVQPESLEPKYQSKDKGQKK